MADARVCAQGNEEWINSLVKKGDLSEVQPWQPWYNDVWTDMPAGYVTTYTTGDPTKDFTFATIRLAGHMVRPRRLLARCSQRFISCAW